MVKKARNGTVRVGEEKALGTFLFIPFHLISSLTLLRAGGGVNWTPPLLFFNIVQKPLELLTFLAFPKYEFNMFSEKFSSIFFFLSVLLMHFLKPTSEFPLFTPLKPPSGLFSVALKPFELLTYKF